MDSKTIAILAAGVGAVWIAMSLLKKEEDGVVPPPPPPPPLPGEVKVQILDLTVS